jgi:hypothetical protein
VDVFVDNDPLLDPPSEAATLGDLLAAMRARDPGRLVVSIRLDGKVIADEQLDSAKALPLSTACKLELETDSIHLLAADALGQAADAMEQIRPHHVRVAELIAAGKNAEAMALLSECLACWNSAEETLRQTWELVGKDLHPAAPGETPEDLVQHVGDLLRRIQERLQARDFVAVADLVEHEMPPAADRWQRMLVGIQQQLLEEA